MRFNFRDVVLLLLALMLFTPTSSSLASENEELREKIGVLFREVQELTQAGESEKAALVRKEITELIKEMGQNRRFPQHLHQEDARKLIEERKEMMHRMAELGREIVELHKSGEHEQAKEVQEELRDLQNEITAVARTAHRPDRPEQEISEKRIHHLHEAAENLEAGGFHDEARSLHERAEAMERELHRRHEARHHHEEKGHEIEKLEHTVMLKMEAMHKTIEQLKHEVARLNKEVEQLRSAKDKKIRSTPQLSKPAPKSSPKLAFPNAGSKSENSIKESKKEKTKSPFKNTEN